MQCHLNFFILKSGDSILSYIKKMVFMDIQRETIQVFKNLNHKELVLCTFGKNDYVFAFFKSISKSEVQFSWIRDRNHSCMLFNTLNLLLAVLVMFNKCATKLSLLPIVVPISFSLIFKILKSFVCNYILNMEISKVMLFGLLQKI